MNLGVPKVILQRKVCFILSVCWLFHCIDCCVVGMVSVTLSANGVANSDPVDENEKDKSDIDEEDGSRPESQQLKVKLLWENPNTV